MGRVRPPTDSAGRSGFRSGGAGVSANRLRTDSAPGVGWAKTDSARGSLTGSRSEWVGRSRFSGVLAVIGLGPAPASRLWHAPPRPPSAPHRIREARGPRECRPRLNVLGLAPSGHPRAWLRLRLGTAALRLGLSLRYIWSPRP